MENTDFYATAPGDIDLSQFDDEYADMEVEDREFDPVPDGKYQVAVEKVEITRSKAAGNPMLKWCLKIIAPRFIGRLLWRNNMMVTKENIRWLKTDLHTCGLELQKLSELPANLEKLLDVKLEVTKRTRGDYENIYINQRLELGDGPSDSDMQEALAAF